MSRLKTHRERHLIDRIGWLRAAVLGANDGIVSTASLIVGVAAAYHWTRGTLYNPDDGVTYNVSAQLVSDNRIVAPVFVSSPYFGQDRTMSRIVRKTTEGWC